MNRTNPMIALIMNRRSCRGQYKPDRVPREDLKTILETGLAAPSGCNKQTVSLIAVDDPEILKQISDYDLINPQDAPIIDPEELRDPRLHQWRNTLRQRYNFNKTKTNGNKEK